MAHNNNGIKLRTLIVLLVIFVAVLVTAVNWYSSINSLSKTLKESYLNNNFEYANKIAASTNDLFISMDQNIHVLSEIMGKKEFTQDDLCEWREANDQYFNSIFTTNHEGVIQLMSPEVIPNSTIKPGVKIETDLMKNTLKEKKPFISDPYHAQSGKLTLLISHPIFDDEGNYKGVVDGTVYLEENSSLSQLTQVHKFRDETTVFVVDRYGQIIYHPDSNRIGDTISNHPLVQDLMNGHSGSSQIINKNGNEYFSGYAYVEYTGWGIIVQTPVTVINFPLQTLTYEMIVKQLPFLILIILIAWFITKQISRPLNQLANYSVLAMKCKESVDPSLLVSNQSRIFEVKQLFKQLQRHFYLMNLQIYQDGLTGLMNRRKFDQTIQDLFEKKKSFSILMIDIDRFKRVNDEFGHLAGDDVIKFLAKLMEDFFKNKGLCYRYGGEEFAIIVANIDEREVLRLGEDFRKVVANTLSPIERPITISIGISENDKNDKHYNDIIERADIALYESKKRGRNCTTVYNKQMFKQKKCH